MNTVIGDRPQLWKQGREYDLLVKQDGQWSQISALSAAKNLRLCSIVHLTCPTVKCCDDQLNPRWEADIICHPCRTPPHRFRTAVAA